MNMFSHLTEQLEREVRTVQKVLVMSEGLRYLMFGPQKPSAPNRSQPENGADEATRAVRTVTENDIDKLDWQIYDHCAALTRIYAAYERFVSELVGEYVVLLPKLFATYPELPPAVTNRHRLGIGRILLKMREKGSYGKLQEEAVVRELAVGLSGAEGYTLLAEAFLIDRQNLRFPILTAIFGALGFKDSGRFVKRHPLVTEFIKRERADNSSAQKELEDFVEYRNEAAHRRVENVLSADAIGSIGRFASALCHALADMVEQAALFRQISVGQYLKALSVSETHYKGFVVIGALADHAHLSVGDELLIKSNTKCERAAIESLQLSGQDVTATTGDGRRRVGIRLTRKCTQGAELWLAVTRAEEPETQQLSLEGATPTATDSADTDLPETNSETIPDARETNTRD